VSIQRLPDAQGKLGVISSFRKPVVTEPNVAPDNVPAHNLQLAGRENLIPVNANLPRELQVFGP
jgi:hypothetical protein